MASNLPKFAVDFDNLPITPERVKERKEEGWERYIPTDRQVVQAHDGRLNPKPTELFAIWVKYE